MIIKNTVDSSVLTALTRKAKTQNALLEALKLRRKALGIKVKAAPKRFIPVPLPKNYDIGTDDNIPF